jgi:hypothetical protein
MCGRVSPKCARTTIIRLDILLFFFVLLYIPSVSDLGAMRFLIMQVRLGWFALDTTLGTDLIEFVRVRRRLERREQVVL